MSNLKKPIFKDVGAITSQLSELKQKTGYIQSFVNKYNGLGLGNLTGEELSELFGNNSKEFISKKLTGDETLKIGNLPANPEKILEIIEKPKGLDEFLTLLDKHNSDRHKRDFYRIEYFSIENGKVVVSPKRKQQIEEYNTVYIENEKQNQIYQVVSEIVGNMNKLKSLIDGRLSIDTFETTVVKRGVQKNGEPTSEYADFVLNPKIIKQFK